MPVIIETEHFRLIPKSILLIIGMILIFGSMATCANETAKDREEGKQMPKVTIEEALKTHSKRLMSLPGVIGTAQGLCNGQPCIKVYVSKTTSKLEKKIPNTLEGYPVVIQETGKFKALPDN